MDKALALQKANKSYVLAQVVRRRNPSSSKPGDKAIITADGQIHGWIGGGCTRGIVLKEALASFKDRKPRLVCIAPGVKDDDKANVKQYVMTCQSGGEVDVFIEPILPVPTITIVGVSHIGQALADIASAMKYTVHVAMADVDRSIFPSADEIMPISDLVARDHSGPNYTIVCTQGEADAQSLEMAIKQKPDYLAFVSSRLKANAIFNELRAKGVSFDDLKKIKTPAGLDLGAKTPHEVAISILAEIIKQYRDDTVQDQGGTDIELSDAYYMNPVCNIPIQKSTAKYVLDYKDEKVYFCCDGCKVSFEKDPKKYMV